MEAELNSEVSEILESALNDKLENYSITLHEGNQKGEGYIGEFLILTLKHLNNKEVHLVIKQATSKSELVHNSFKTEIYFYQTLLPQLLDFQKKFAPSLQDLTITPKCLATNLHTGVKRIVLENLKYRNFELMDRRKSFDKDHLELLMKSYAKLHALSFAMKEKCSGDYSELIKPFGKQTEQFKTFVVSLVNSMLNNIIKFHSADFDDPLIDKLNEYVTNLDKIFLECNKYEGEHSVVIHGDCWSNNMMFRYNVSLIISNSHIIIIVFYVNVFVCVIKILHFLISFEIFSYSIMFYHWYNWSSVSLDAI